MFLNSAVRSILSYECYVWHQRRLEISILRAIHHGFFKLICNNGIGRIILVALSKVSVSSKRYVDRLHYFKKSRGKKPQSIFANTITVTWDHYFSKEILLRERYYKYQMNIAQLTHEEIANITFTTCIIIPTSQLENDIFLSR